MRLALFVVAFIAGAALAQTRTETADASSPTPSELHCTRSSSGDWECFACVTFSTTVDTGVRTFTRQDTACGRPRILNATVNRNRAANLAEALAGSALRQAGFEAVDGGAL